MRSGERRRASSGERFRARERKREREGVGEFPLTTTKLRSGDVVEERQWNGGATAAGSSSKSGGVG